MKTKISILFALFISNIGLYAQASAPKYSNEFLSIGVGARALGMSNAYVSSVNDVTSGYWNPAGLLGIKDVAQAGLMHSEYFAGIAKYDFGAFAKPIDSVSALGITLIRFGVDDIPNTTELIDANGNIDYSKISSFSAADYALMFSYARKLNLGKLKGVRLGSSAKIIRRKVGDFAGAWGFGIDAGLQYNSNKWSYGLMARDITTTFNAWSYNLSETTKQTFVVTGNEIPDNSIEVTLPRLMMGVARKFNFYQSKISLLTEFNMDATFDGKRNVVIKSNLLSIDPHIGFELGYMNFLFLRTGVGNIQRTTDILNREVTTFQPNLGIGFKVKIFTIDYALTDIGDKSVALYSNVFSIKVDINKKR
jgi:hypothetical protein